MVRHMHLPEIQAPAPSLDFVNIPQGLTSYKAVSFKIKGGRQVRFRITGNPTGQFDLTPMGTEFKADPVDADDFYYGYVWVQMASVAGAIPNSSVSIHTYSSMTKVTTPRTKVMSIRSVTIRSH